MQPTATPPPVSADRPAPRREISRRWWLVVGVAWLVVVAVAGVWGLAHPEPTDREQTTVAGAKPFVDEAIARVASAATAGNAAVVAVSGFDRVGSCDVSVVRGGERYRRSLVAVLAPGSELETLDRVAASLPAHYRPTVRRGDRPRLSADAGYFVFLTGTVTAPGEITFIADTGDCRPLGDPVAGDTMPASPDWAAATLARLGLRADTATEAQVSCVDGGVLGTSQVRAGAYSGDLEAELADLPGITLVVTAQPSAFAFLTDEGQVAVRVLPNETIVTVTTLCQ